MSSSTAVPDADSHSPSTRPSRPLWRRVLKWVGIVVVALLVLAALALAYLWWRIPQNNLDPLRPGSLSVATGGEYRAGPFTVTVAQDGGGGITVTETDGGATVWRTAPGVPFLSAGQGSVSFDEHFGYFWADVQRDSSLTDQTVATVREKDDSVVVTGAISASGGADPVNYTMTLAPVRKAPGVEVLAIDATTGDQKVASLMLTSGRDPNEQSFGLGEQYRPLDLTGSVTPLLTGEQGLGRGEQPVTFMTDISQWAGGNLTTTYAVAPTLVTSANRSLELADVTPSGAFGVVDLSREGQTSIESWASTLSAEAAVGDSPDDILQIRAAGRSRPALAKWVQKGAVLGLQGGTQRVEQIVADMEAAGTEISAVWLQDWTGKRVTSFGDRLWWTWQLDQAQYPDWDGMVRRFAAKGIKVLTYVNIMVVDSSEKPGKPVDNLFKDAERKGYLVKNQEGDTYLADQNGYDAALVDFTNPAARDWYADVIAEDVLGAGASGFMADFGEALPMDAVLHRGIPLEEHNRWPQLWSEVVQEGCRRAGQPECVAFMRSAFLRNGDHVPLMWAGDQMVDYSTTDGLASAVYSMVGGGLSGMPLWHSDIGGYTSLNVLVKNYVRPPDLNERWSEMQAFGVVMRTHETNRPEVNQQVYDTEATRQEFARMSQLYADLYPYRKTVIDEATRTGLPAMRSMWQVHPEMADADVDLQFFLGTHLFMAPVVQEKATDVQVTFPSGTWEHVLTGEVYQGDQTTTVPAPLGTPAAFVEQDDPVGDEIIAAVRKNWAAGQPN